MTMITSPKLMATPTWPSAPVFGVDHDRATPANTSANVPTASATTAAQARVTGSSRFFAPASSTSRHTP